MTLGKWMGSAVVATVGGAVLAAGWATTARAAPTTEPSATTRPAAHHKGVTKPWSELKSLTPGQQDKIARIHEDATEQERKVREKEHDDIVALLTPEQQAELADLEGKTAADRKERLAAGRHKKGDATTQPAK